MRGEEELTIVQCEASFLDKAKAEAFYVARNAGNKREFIENNLFDIVRVIHEVEITE
jgi:hypothetical protein